MKETILSVIIPAYNEETTIDQVVRDHLKILSDLKVKDYEILCLDDASQDNTPEILKKLSFEFPKVRVLIHSKNKGTYESFSELAREAKGTHIYQTGADGQWPAENLKRLYEASVRGNFDLTIGVRENRRKIYSLWRRILSFGFNILPKLFFGVETRDANGIKLGAKEIFNIKLLSKSFFGEIERVIEAERLGYNVGFEPMHFLPRGGGRATGAKWKNILATARDFLRYFIFRNECRSSNESLRKK